MTPMNVFIVLNEVLLHEYSLFNQENENVEIFLL